MEGKQEYGGFSGRNHHHRSLQRCVERFFPDSQQLVHLRVIDQIKKPKTLDTDHYGIASELQSEIEQNFSFTLVDGTTLNYQAAKAAGIDIEISYYGLMTPPTRAIPN